jgi:hypothetical protein
MRHVACFLLAMTLAAAEKDFAGVWTGKWSGIAGAGDFRIALTLADGKLKPDVMFTMGSIEVKTKVTHIAVEGSKLEMKYEFDLEGSHLESTIQGTLNGTVLEGSYSTKALPGGSTADQGEFKASRRSN